MLIAAEIAQWQPVMEPVELALQQLLDDAAAQNLTLGELLPKLAQLLPTMPTERLTNALTRSAFAAHLGYAAGLDADPKSQAAAAGQWERLQAAKRTHPYARYITKRDERVREAHRRWDNLVLPVDHPFWQAHWPPNGWRCRCRAIGVSQREYDRGVTPTGAPMKKEAPEEVLRKYTNPRTGEITDLPVGIDPGFAYNAGVARQQALFSLAADKLRSANPSLAQQAMAQTLFTEAQLKDWMSNPQGEIPLLVIGVEDAAKIGAQTVVAKLSAETAKKQLRHHPELEAAEYLSAQKVIDQNTTVVQDGEKSLIFIREAYEGTKRGYVVVVKATASGQNLFVTSYRRLSSEDARRDKEIERLLLKGQKK